MFALFHVRRILHYEIDKLLKDFSSIVAPSLFKPQTRVPELKQPLGWRGGPSNVCNSARVHLLMLKKLEL